MTFVSILACVVFLLWSPCATANDAFGHACTAEKLSMFSDGWPAVFDARVYWFGLDGTVERATGKPSNGFYDPMKPTLIWMDGFNGLYHVSSCARMISHCVPAANCEKGNEYVANPWVRRGWNFGIFYWDQFADEDCFYSAEMKIWGQGGKAGMTWKSFDPKTGKGGVHQYEGPEISVAQLCASSIQSALPTFTGSSLQLNGFSLGGQLAAACADVLFQTPEHPALPTSLTLLEPMFSSHAKPWSAHPFHACWPFSTRTLNSVNWTAEVVDRLFVKQRVPTALYKSSWLGRCCGTASLVFDPGTQLDILGTVVRWDPVFCGNPLNYMCYHEVIVPFYFLNWGATHVNDGGPTSGNCKIPNAQCTDAELFDLVVQHRLNLTGGKEHLWKQVQGMNTWTLSDDVFGYDVNEDPPPKPPVPADPPPTLYQSDSLDVSDVRSSGVFFLLGSVGVVLMGLLALSILRVRSSSHRCIIPTDPEME